MIGTEIRQMVRERFSDAVISEHEFRGDDTLVMDRRTLHAVMQFLRDDPLLRFDLLVDVTAVDYPDRDSRFEVVYHLYSIPLNHRLRICFPVPEEEPVVPSVVDLWVSADWMEREVYDMFGVKFIGHPNLRRILTHELFDGHPLRKDYPVNRRTTLHPPVEDLLTRKPFNG